MKLTPELEAAMLDLVQEQDPPLQAHRAGLRCPVEPRRTRAPRR